MRREKSTSPSVNTRNKLLWSLLFILIAAASVFAVTSLSKEFSFADFWRFVSTSQPGYLIAAIICMLGFIILEGAALVSVNRTLCNQHSLRKGFVYASADFYFSAITPSATGGQPASAYFMIKDGIPPLVAAVTLLVNLAMYTLSIVVIAVLCFVFRPNLFLGYDTFSKILILIGTAIPIGLVTLLVLVLKKGQLLYRLCHRVIHWLGKLHILRHEEKTQEKLRNIMDDYGRYADIISHNRRMLIKAFILSFIQRVSQITVTVFAYLATGGDAKYCFDIWIIQSYAILGSNCVPIPGAVGAVDYLLIHGFDQLPHVVPNPTNLELFSRSLSFYICIAISGITVLFKYLSLKLHQPKGEAL